MRVDSAEILFQSFLAGGPCEQLCHKHGCPLFDVVHPAFPLPTMALPTLKGALKDGFWEAVIVCDMSEPCKFPSLDSCQKRLLWAHKEVILLCAQLLVLWSKQEMQFFFRHLVSNAWIFFSQSASRVHVSQP